MLGSESFISLFAWEYTVIHLLVVDVACVLFWTQSVCMVPHQNTRNIYHKQMNNGVPRNIIFCLINKWAVEIYAFE